MTKICIDPGHGGIQPGASYYGFSEKDAALAIGLELYRILRERGYEAFLTRSTDEDMSLKERCDISNSWKANLFISIHCNASHSPDARGVEVWTWSGNRLSVAEHIQSQLVQATGFKNRGVKSSGVYYVLRHTKAPALVVECGFMSNKFECQLLFDPEVQKKIAFSIAFGIEETITK